MSDDLVKRLLEPFIDTFFGPVIEPIKKEAASRIEELEAALEPFSRFPIGVVGDECDEMEVYQCHGWPSDQLAVVTVADFWRARKALGEQK
jgi:hypothetical protein